MTEAELLREALEALKAQWGQAHYDSCENLACAGGGKWCMWPRPATITKLEERLLRE